MVIFFISLVVKGAFKEGAIAFILEHYKAHFDLYQKIDDLFFFMKFAQFEE